MHYDFRSPWESSVPWIGHYPSERQIDFDDDLEYKPP